MESKKLSARALQPGHFTTYREAEENFTLAARSCLARRYEVEPKPSDLRKCFGRYGLLPDASITSARTGRKFFVEVKRQNEGGNAEERAYKHHTSQFQQFMRDLYGYKYHPYVTIFCKQLATNPRYTEKIRHLIEPDHYFLWVDYELAPLRTYLRARCREWLDD